jgi:hypothetical protein
MFLFLHWSVDSLVAEFFYFPVDSGYYSLIGGVAGKHFLPFCELSLESGDYFLSFAEPL